MRALSDRWNFRVWLRNWLTAPSKKELEQQAARRGGAQHLGDGRGGGGRGRGGAGGRALSKLWFSARLAAREARGGVSKW